MTNTDALILLVDDFSAAREMYAKYVTACGYRVITAASGAEAWETAHRPERPTLILVDLQTRAMDVTTFLRSLRSEPAFADVPIIAFNAHDMAEEHDQALRDGFDAVISRPCPLPGLIMLIRPFLDRQRDSGS